MTDSQGQCTVNTMQKVLKKPHQHTLIPTAKNTRAVNIIEALPIIFHID